MSRFYEVIWAVDFEGEHFDSPEEAAAEALGLILSGEHLVFTVVDKVTEQTTEVEITGVEFDDLPGGVANIRGGRITLRSRSQSQKIRA